MYDALHEALHSLQPTGAAGLEGLVQGLIGRLTGHRFFLAKSGAQAGKDVSTGGYGETYIDIECKRFRRGESPTTRDLNGGLAEAITASAGRLDLWLVVSTGAIGSTEAEVLRRTAEREAVAVEIVDWQEAELPQLALLCAALPQQSLADLEARGAQGQRAAIAAELKAVADDPSFPNQLDDLQRRLRSADLGLDHARAAANAWIESRLANKADALASFHQLLCVGDASFQPYVERARPQAELDAWYDTWSAEPNVAAVLGGEGNGKSWTTMAWWARLSAKPLTLMITSNCEIPSDAATLIASALKLQTNMRDIVFWKRRLDQWLRRPPPAGPILLLMLDGLNERPRQAWDELFASLAESRLAGRIAIVATCRPAFWSERVADFLPDHLRAARIEVQPFNDLELGAAWGARRPTLAEMPAGVRDFIRTPRILRLARSHMEHLIESGDVTVERLLIEDWADRRRLKLGFAHSIPEFSGLVMDLARELRKGVRDFGVCQLRDYSSLARRSPTRDLDKDFDEIIDGRLFEPIGLLSDRYRVRTEHVGLALGMLLAREARQAYGDQGTAGVEALLAEALDPVGDLDQTSASLRGASAVACLEPEYPTEARRVLLRTWLRLPNLDEAQWSDFAAYLPLDPKTFFDLAEDFWFEVDDFPKAREWVADAILRWRNATSVDALIVTRCSRWLGLWHREWRNFAGGREPDESGREVRAVHDDAALLSAPECPLPTQLLSEATAPGAPSISRLALLLISHRPRAAYVDGFVAWALGRAVMRWADEIEEVAWCLRLNEHDPVETERALLMNAEALIGSGLELGLRAARHLLWACGTSASAELLAALPPLPQLEWWPLSRPDDGDPLDPVVVAPADLAATTDQLAGLKPLDMWSSFVPPPEEHELDRLEPSLARFAPRLLGGFYREVLRTAAQRQGIQLRQLGWHVPKHLLLIRPAEAHALDQARRSLFPVLNGDLDDARATEAYILMGVLSQHAVVDQFALLLERPEAARDLLLLERVLGDVPDQVANDLIVDATAEGSGAKMGRVLWMLGRHPFTLSDAARNVVVRCFDHPDPVVRGSAFRLACRCVDLPALGAHGASGWTAAAAGRPTLEPFYGSRALIEGAEPVDYLALRARVIPELWGYLARQDGTSRGLGAFAEDLDALWETMSSTPSQRAEEGGAGFVLTWAAERSTVELQLADIGSMPEGSMHTVKVFGRRRDTDGLQKVFGRFDLGTVTEERLKFTNRVRSLIAEAEDAGRWLFGRPMRDHALGEIVARRTDLVDKWAAGRERCNAAGWDVAEFYRAMCGALGATDPDRAAEILAWLRRASPGLQIVYGPVSVDSVTWLAFHLPASAKVDALREQLLNEAYTDALIFEIGLAAQAGGAAAWLQQMIERDLRAPGVLRPARALTLVGVLDEGVLLDSLRHHFEGHDGFLAEVAKGAGTRIEQNRRARAWFTKFVEHRDAIEAWAAFRLFLRCVDRRFYLWREVVLSESPDLPLLWRQQVAVNEQDIRRAAEKNEGRLSETLFGLRISEDEIAPWCRTPVAPDVA